MVRTCSWPPFRTNVPLCALLLLPDELRFATEKLYSPAAGASDRAIASSRRKCCSGWARMTHSMAIVGTGGIDLSGLSCFSTSWNSRGRGRFRAKL